jgi:hypothetical protein
VTVQSGKHAVGNEGSEAESEAERQARAIEARTVVVTIRRDGCSGARRALRRRDASQPRQPYRVSHLLTLNVADSGHFSGLTPVHPNSI